MRSHCPSAIAWRRSMVHPPAQEFLPSLSPALQFVHTIKCMPWIMFDDSNEVEFQGFPRPRSFPRTSLENFRWRVERRWRQWFP
jgi:hypothetical protein